MGHVCLCTVSFGWILLNLHIQGQDIFDYPSLVISPTIVNENSSQTLTCQYKGNGNISSVSWFANNITQGALRINGSCLKLFWRNENLHSYTCDITKKIFNLTILNVMRSNRNDEWRCETTLNGSSNPVRSNTVKPAIKVPITIVTMTGHQNDRVTTEENVSRRFQCVTSGGLPEPIVKWYNDSRTPEDTRDDIEINATVTSAYNQSNDDLIITTSVLTIITSKFDDQISIYCSAYSSPDQTPLYSAQKPKLNVIHGPDGPPVIIGLKKGVPYRVIENSQGQLTCVITGGNPLPTLTWTCYNIGTTDKVDDKTVSKTARWTAVRGPDLKCTCFYSHPKKIGYISIQVQTLYPPNKPLFHIKSTEVNGKIHIVKHNQVSITCSSSGRPDDIEYSWSSNTGTTFGNVMTVNKVENNGQYICYAKNFLDQTDGEVVIGSNTSSISLEMLYPPVVKSMQNQSILEGDTLSFPCPVTDGNPSMTSFKWTTSNDTRVWNTQILTIVNVSRSDAMLYSCEVANVMTETAELLQISIPDSKTFFLNVMYETTVKDFYVGGLEDKKSVTVNETENVHLYCNVESNPGSDIVIKNQTGYVMKSGSGVNNLNHLLLSVTCLDAGTYTCSGSNGYGTRESMEQLTLYVNCAPMLSPKLQIKTAIRTAEHNSAVLTFRTVAYPKPFKEDFLWFRWYNNEWKPLKNDQAFQIDTETLESNLTVYYVNKTFYGIYKLIVKNTMGQYEQMFLLQPEESQFQSSCPDSNTKSIITGVILGVVIAALALYAGYLTFLLKRSGFHEGRAQSRNITENITNISTYANLAFSTDVTVQQESLDVRESGVSKYTD